MKPKNDAAISGVIAGAGKLMGDWMKAKGVEPSLKSGMPQSSKIGINVRYEEGLGWITDKGHGVSSFYAHTMGNQNPFFQMLNLLPGSPAFAAYHDIAMNNAGALWTTASIPQYYIIAQTAASAQSLLMLHNIEQARKTNNEQYGNFRNNNS